MSGIVGFINLDHESADSETLLKLCQPLECRAPDGTNIWLRNGAGLGHALLLTSPGEKAEPQPYSLDGKIWLTSDTHLCGKDELSRVLRAAGVNVAADASDQDLLLLAYRAYGDDCARYLLGDFAFAMWDEQKQKLICVRDHLGVRPLFYSHSSDLFIFGSDIDALLAHPKVDPELNDEYIADFLLFGSSIESEPTAYRHIKRLPAAHYLVVDAAGVRLRRYWTAPLHQEIRYSRDSEYTEHFASLFDKAVTERMPATGLAVDLSGGMDSSSIAAVSVAHAKKNGRQVFAFTNTCETLLPEDREGRYAKMISAYLNIPIEFLASEDCPLFDRFDSVILRTAEPFANPGLAQSFDMAQRITASGVRVLLTGQMGDTLFAGSSTYFPHLFKSGQWVKLVSEALTQKRKTGSLKGTGLRAMVEGALRRSNPKTHWQPGMPSWIRPQYAAQIKLDERWHAIWQMWGNLNDTYGQLQRPWFSQFFEGYHSVRLPIIVRHPFSDIRLVEFMLGLPAYMHHDKRVLREAMHDRLPTEIVSRPKEGLPGDLQRAKMKTGLRRAIPDLSAVEYYIDGQNFKSAYDEYLEHSSDETTWSSWLINSPIALAYWMNNNIK